MSEKLEHAARVALNLLNCPTALHDSRVPLIVPHLGIADDGGVVVLDKNGAVRTRYEVISGQMVPLSVAELILELCEVRGRGLRSEMAWPR